MTAPMPGTWASSPQSGDRTGGISRRKRKTRTPHDRRSSVWRGLSSWRPPRHRAPSCGTARMRCDSCPLFGRPARALQITRNPLCRWCHRPSPRRPACLRLRRNIFPT
ncbi:hypothetical protein Tc00.1047053508159.70 [Trypanosoma cruzi]|uniref:Uncharacterized protein n=1 Tax=Trypanosoma cruzi (strain CL Brener) TaxID=353153 RepID=Q4DE07_TRYCC|nr:hypothetical protein Tc00.1047053508159.70 [Trypanosoma cruzi]EAN90760.1 hypothetical protein Tc00.1047053508159.70 [Trypanosoma cruzi]|eukprot:XP_812611.1 hypothetical protein [Trypanosoma cruzi strain CL Brener]